MMAIPCMAHPGWRARLELGIERRAARSVLARRCHEGPLRVQRPFYPEGGEVCHMYVLHPPGGVVGGDELEIDVTVKEDAAALLTTPAAGKYYRSDGVTARLTQRFTVDDGAVLEWLPQETIVFDGAYAAVNSRVDLAMTGRFMGWEIVCLGRPGAGEVFAHGRLRQCWEIWRGGKPLFIERALYEQGGAALDAAWGLSSQSVSGTLVCVGDGAGLAERVRTATAPLNGEGLFSVTQLAEALVCRYLGRHAEEARWYFASAWEILRPAQLQRAACVPRIWAT